LRYNDIGWEQRFIPNDGCGMLATMARYRHYKRSTAAKKELLKNPDDEQLKADVAAYEAVIDDACT